MIKGWLWTFLFESCLILCMSTVFIWMSRMASITMIWTVSTFTININRSAISTFFPISNVSQTGIEWLPNFIEVSIVNIPLIQKSVLTLNHLCNFFFMFTYTTVSTFIFCDWFKFQNNSIIFLWLFYRVWRLQI